MHYTKNIHNLLLVLSISFLILSCSSKRYSYRKKIAIKHVEHIVNEKKTALCKTIHLDTIKRINEGAPITDNLEASSETGDAHSIKILHEKYINNNDRIPNLLLDTGNNKIKHDAPHSTNVSPDKLEVSPFAVLGFSFAILFIGVLLTVGIFTNQGVMFSLIIAAIAFIFSLLGLIQTRNGKWRGRKLARAGMVIILSALIISFILLILATYLGGAGSSSTGP